MISRGLPPKNPPARDEAPCSGSALSRSRTGVTEQGLQGRWHRLMQLQPAGVERQGPLPARGVMVANRHHPTLPATAAPRACCRPPVELFHNPPAHTGIHNSAVRRGHPYVTVQVGRRHGAMHGTTPPLGRVPAESSGFPQQQTPSSLCARDTLCRQVQPHTSPPSLTVKHPPLTLHNAISRACCSLFG